jgi:chaperonin GroES
MTKLHPRNNHVLLLPDEGEKMKGKLYIPESAVVIPTRGTIMAVGPGYLLADGTRSEMDLREGDRVEFHAGPGHPIREIDGEVYFILREDEVICKVTDEPIPEMAMPDEPEEPVVDPTELSDEEERRILAAG